MSKPLKREELHIVEERHEEPNLHLLALVLLAMVSEEPSVDGDDDAGAAA